MDGKWKIVNSGADAVRKPYGGVGEAIWIQMGQEKVQERTVQLMRCLVGRWSEGSTHVPSLSSPYGEVNSNWSFPKDVTNISIEDYCGSLSNCLCMITSL